MFNFNQEKWKNQMLLWCEIVELKNRLKNYIFYLKKCVCIKLKLTETQWFVYQPILRIILNP